MAMVRWRFKNRAHLHLILFNERTLSTVLGIYSALSNLEHDDILVGPSLSHDEEALVLCKGREARPSKTQRTQIWPLPLAQWVALGTTPNCVTLSFPLCKMDIITRAPPSWGLL